MADTAVAITAGSGTNIDTRTEATNGNHRQVVVLGDPSTNAGVAPVDATKGLAVDLSATGANATALKVDASATTQPVSAASLPLPAGAATSTKQDTGNTSLASIDTKTPALGQALAAASVPVILPSATVTTLTPPTTVTVQQSTASNLKVDPSGVTSPVSAASLPLPSGASTSAKQPALGTAGTASADVISVQGVASMTALKVDGSATTQPVSGTVTANATLAAETTKVIGVTRTADGSGNLITSTTNALDVNIKSGASSGSQYTQGGATVANPTGTAEIWFDASGNPKAITPSQPLPSNITDGTNTAHVLKSDGTAVGQNAQLIASTYLSVPFTTTTVQAVGTTDAGNYRFVTVQVSAFTTGSATFQVSNDNVNWQTVVLGVIGSGNSAATSVAASLGMWSGQVPGRYFRVNVTAVTGTYAGTIVFSALAGAPGTMGVSAQLTGSIPLADASSNPTAPLVGGFSASFNGSTWDRMRNNITAAVIAAGATASNAGVSVTTFNASRAVIVVNISAFTSGSLTVTINGVTSSGYTYPILTSTALAAVAVTPLRIFPGATASANAVANDMVPKTIQVVTTVTGTLTYGIDSELSV